MISTITTGFPAVLPVSGVSDALAGMVFSIGTDALGDYIFGEGQMSALSDAMGFPVDFTAETQRIRVIPASATAGLLAVPSMVPAKPLDHLTES